MGWDGMGRDGIDENRGDENRGDENRRMGRREEKRIGRRGGRRYTVRRERGSRKGEGAWGVDFGWRKGRQGGRRKRRGWVRELWIVDWLARRVDMYTYTWVRDVWMRERGVGSGRRGLARGKG